MNGNEMTNEVTALQKEVAESKAEALFWKNEFESTKECLTQEKINIQSSLMKRLEASVKQCEAICKEKENMVVKFAMAEKLVLVEKKEKENVEKKLKDFEKNKEILREKIRNLNDEKSRMTSTLDKKVQEVGIASRNCDKFREEVSDKDTKIKWAQHRLKEEMEAHKETQAKLNSAVTELCHVNVELKTLKEDREESEQGLRVSSCEGSPEAAALEKRLQEAKAEVVVENEKKNEFKSLYENLKSEHEQLQTRHLFINSEINTLKAKITEFERERTESEKLFNSLQSELKNSKQETLELNRKLQHLTNVENLLKEEKEQTASLLKSEDELQEKLHDKDVELSECRRKETELLACTHKLTDKNVLLQNKMSLCQSKLQSLESGQIESASKLAEMEGILSNHSDEKKQLEQCKKTEVERLLNLLSEVTEEKSKLRSSVTDLENELEVQRKRHSKSIRDSNREIQKLRSKLETSNSSAMPTVPEIKFHNRDQPANDGGSVAQGDLNSVESHTRDGLQDSLSQASRTSSEVSLNADLSNACNFYRNDRSYSPNHVPSISVKDVPQHVLLNRIAELQSELAKQREKTDFLEEHATQLVQELKRKKKLIHFYFMKEEAGALADSSSDEAKAHLVKQSGIMASVFGSTPKDDTMTLELSLEINKKLQTLLEDTLLKNITLKDSLNTLGEEVAKLSSQNLPS